MKTFTDKNGKEWPIEINVAQVKRVLAATGTNLCDATDPKFYVAMANDPIRVCDILYILCADEAKKASIDAAAFGALLAGDVLEAASDAFVDELNDFFPSSSRVVLQEGTKRSRELQKKLTAQRLAAINSDLMTRKLEDELASEKRDFEQRMTSDQTLAQMASHSTSGPGSGKPPA